MRMNTLGLNVGLGIRVGPEGVRGVSTFLPVGRSLAGAESEVIGPLLESSTIAPKVDGPAGVGFAHGLNPKSPGLNSLPEKVGMMGAGQRLLPDRDRGFLLARAPQGAVSALVQAEEAEPDARVSISAPAVVCAWCSPGVVSAGGHGICARHKLELAAELAAMDWRNR